MKHLKASTLVLDYNLYPREKIDPTHIREMAESLALGITLPPILVDRESKRVIDGFHRIRAHQKVYDLDVEVPVILKTYNNDMEMFLEAMRLNASHGRKLSPYDKARCLARAEELKLEPEIVASALHMAPQRLGEIKATRFAQYKAEPIVLKRTAAHMAGGELTQEQVAYNTKAGGMNQSFYINQITTMLEADAVDWANHSVTSGLQRLHELLEQTLSVKV